MTAQLLKQIRNAEAGAEEKLSACERRAGELVLNGKRESEERIKEVEKKAADVLRAIEERTLASADEMIKKEQTAANEEAREMKLRCEVNLDEAVKLIVLGIMNKCR